ncbi:MAG: hypothetical protein ABIH91_00575, partial [Candidatus Omnitrophota bacterium]
PLALKQLKNDGLLSGIEIHAANFSFKENFKLRFLAVCLLWLKVFWLAAKAIFSGITVRLILNQRFISWSEKNAPAYVIRTWLNPRVLNFTNIYSDPYFGSLPAYLSQKGYKVLVIAGIYGPILKILSFLNKKKALTFLPEIFFLRPLDCFRTAGIALFKRINLKEKVIFRGIEVSSFFSEALEKGYLSSAIYQNATRFFVAKNLAKKLKKFIYLQPFENYAWEKAMILGLKSGQEKDFTITIFGFQHAFISRDSFKYFSAPAEEPLMPLPQKIITLGEVTRRILSEKGRYCSLELRAGCALRQEYIRDSGLLSRKTQRKLLVPLTMVKAESLKIISFLEKSQICRKGYSIILRFHPLFGFGALKKEFPQGLPSGFMVDSAGSAVEAIKQADIVCYTWSTVAIEALKLGVPVIYLDILKPMRVDPLFQCANLKSSVEFPEELALSLEKIYNLSAEQFLNEQALSQAYLKEYFNPVDEAHLRSFLPE